MSTTGMQKYVYVMFIINGESESYRQMRFIMNFEKQNMLDGFKHVMVLKQTTSTANKQKKALHLGL